MARFILRAVSIFLKTFKPDSLSIACIGLGSNLGNSRRILCDAWRTLGAHPAIRTLRLSSPYRTEPVNMASANWFINAAGTLETSLTPEELLDTLLALEEQFGRTRRSDDRGYQDRTLDLDLLLMDDRIIQTARLVLPHPEMHCRLFVLAPLAEIVPDLTHPVLHRTIRDLLHSLTATAGSPLMEPASWRE